MHVHELLSQTVLPDLFGVTRHFPDDAIRDVRHAVHAAMDASGLAQRLPSEGRGGGLPTVALGVGSRGIGLLPEITRAVAEWFSAHGTRPFIVPAMGSHGGGDAQGQADVLAHLGITEDSVGCPIKSSMEVVEVGRLQPEASPVYMDALAAAADAVFVINRIKPHTAFSGPHESGLVKMLAIGLGKHKGADSCHQLGFGAFADIMPRMSALVLEQCPHILGGLAIVENSRDLPCLVEAVPREHLVRRDAELLFVARERMAALPTDTLDALLVLRMGKNISGGGMDPNITGRSPSPFKTGGPNITKIAVLRLTEETQGNATGMGAADITTRQLVDGVDFEATYANVITSTVLRSGCTPVTMPDEESAVRCLLKTCNAGNRPVRLIFIRDTLSLEKLWVSPAVAEDLRRATDCAVDARPNPLRFDDRGTLVAPGWE